MAEHILVVDDELSMREFLAILLERQGYKVMVAGSAEEAMRRMDDATFDLVLSDINMPGISGLELLGRVRNGNTPQLADVPFVMVTAFGSTDSAVEAMKLGASDYVTKPFNNEELLIFIRKALGSRALEQENLQLRRELKQTYGYHSLIGGSSRMRAVYDLIRRVKDSRISVFVHGESGTGKELVARALHYSGERQNGPFVPVNCGAIPETLIESELFGAKRGAFTGANRDREGYFEAANGGTLFLDEIGEMPLHAQVKLLRAIAERKVTRVGDTAEREVDVRIIAATNRELEDEVAAGRFREDLYYRLNVVRIDLPPLREREDDIVVLAEHFVRLFAKEYVSGVSGLTPEVRQLVASYAWPGNVRELRNAMEGAVALETEDRVTLRSLPARITRTRGEQTRPALQDGELPELSLDQALPADFALDELLADVERSYLLRALDECDGNKTAAAGLLGMTFRSFRYRLKRHDL